MATIWNRPNVGTLAGTHRLVLDKANSGEAADTVHATVDELVAYTVADENIASGTWTPTGTALVNLDSVTPGAGQYIRVGDVVTVGIQVLINPTASGPVAFALSTPVTTAFTSSGEASGVALSLNGATAELGSVVAQAASSDVVVSIENTATISVTSIVSFSYQVIAP